MFDATSGVAFGYILCGIIWALALGFAVGNYACSLVHRLPRGRLILDKPPYCGTCGTPLAVKDLFPVISGLMLKHRCRYCGTPYPVSHTWTELLVGLLFVLTFLEYNFSEQFLLIAFIGVFLITLAAIEANEGIIMTKILLCTAISGMIYRTLEDGTIYGFFDSGFFGLLIGALLWHKHIKPVGHIYTLPPQVYLFITGGICAGAHGLPVFLALFAVFYGADWLVRRMLKKPAPHITLSFGLATILPVMYPALTII